jgi:ABC-2 type transport system permease protein
MIKLLKYELLRKKRIYIVMLSIFAVFTLLTAFGIPRLDRTYWFIIVLVSGLICLVGGALSPFIINTAKYYGDYKNRNGYMMFLTPNSGAKIFGSKILAAVVDTLSVFILLALYGFIAYSVANANYDITPQLNEIWSEIQMQFPSLSFGTLITVLSVSIIVQNVTAIILALFSITVSKILLSHRSINWFIPLLIFILLSWIEQIVSTVIIAAANFKDLKDLFLSSAPTLQISMLIITALGISIAFAITYTIVGSTLISKKLDL